MHLTMAKKQQDNPDDSRLESDEDLDDVVDSVIGAEDNSKEITDSGTEEAVSYTHLTLPTITGV